MEIEKSSSKERNLLAKIAAKEKSGRISSSSDSDGEPDGVVEEAAAVPKREKPATAEKPTAQKKPFSLANLGSSSDDDSESKSPMELDTDDVAIPAIDEVETARAKLVASSSESEPDIEASLLAKKAKKSKRINSDSDFELPGDSDADKKKSKKARKASSLEETEDKEDVKPKSKLPRTKNATSSSDLKLYDSHQQHLREYHREVDIYHQFRKQCAEAVCPRGFKEPPGNFIHDKWIPISISNKVSKICSVPVYSGY